MSADASKSSDGGAKYPQELLDSYAVKDTLGTGGFAKVKLGRHRMTGEKVAIKIMDKAELEKTDDLKRVALEIQALKDMRHQNISRLYQVIETAEKYFLVLEYAPGGELFDYIVARDRCKEDEARKFFRQICKAVYHCHARGYAHRDLKPENLLLDANRNIKLIDFGLVARPASLSSDLLKTCCGSAAYAAPELIRGERYLGQPADMWSLGILLYALLCGFLPFDDDNTQRLYRLIQRGQYEIPEWLSEGSQRVIGALLKHRPEHRITMEDLLKHPWMLKGSNADRIDPSSSYGDTGVLEITVVHELAKYYNVPSAQMEAFISEWAYDSITAQYELLCLRRSKGHSIRLPAGKGKLPPERARAIVAAHSRSSLFPRSEDESDILSVGSSLAAANSRESLTGASSPHIFLTGTSSESLHNRPTSPFQSNLTAMAYVGSMDNIALASRATEQKGLQRHASNPDIASSSAPAESSQQPTRARATRKSVRGSFQSLARGVRNLFGGSSHHRLHEPRKVKGLFNVSTTSTKPPAEVFQEVLRVLSEKGCQIREKGFVVKARFPSDDGNSYPLHVNFEVCRLDGMENIVGIKLTRVKGDTWAYKRACEDVVSQLHI